MKIKTIFHGLAAFALVVTAQAQVTVDITGASAFRVATLDTIKAQFVASGQPFKFAHDQSGSFNGATLSIWQGTFAGIPNVTIRTRFNGSLEGIRALIDSPASDPLYLDPVVLNGVTATIGGNNGGNGLISTTGPTQAGQSEIAFSDVSVAATPYAGAPLEPADPEAGVVVFTIIANEGAPAGLTNVTNKQFQALFGRGYLPLDFFTGNVNDSGSYVFATGRNDGSGTRTTYLAETGYGITTPVQQYVRNVISGDTITQIQRVPAGGVNNPALPGQSASNRSTIWGLDVAGNGGYNSGGDLRGDMGRTSANTQVLDADGSILIGAGDAPIHLVTFLALGDAVTARSNGAKILAYNGEILSSIAGGASTLSEADQAKITQGVYTAWSYQQMYLRPGLTSGDEVTIYNAIKSNLVLGTSGIPISEMKVSRSVDGGVVAP